MSGQIGTNLPVDDRVSISPVVQCEGVVALALEHFVCGKTVRGAAVLKQEQISVHSCDTALITRILVISI